MKHTSSVLLIIYFICVLMMVGCSQKQILSVRQSGQDNVIDISAQNMSLLPTGVASFTLSPGDVLRLEATPKKGIEQEFLLERGDSIKISFHYDGGDYRIMSGDMLSIFMKNDSPLNLETTVRLDGRITIPRLGELTASGMTPVELSAILSDKFKGKINDPKITVSVLRSNMDPFTAMAGEYFVLSDGTVSIPILGIFKAHGSTLENLSKMISAEVLKTFDNHFKVSLSAQSFAIEQLKEYDKVLTVTPSGDFMIPQVGNINVKGKTLPQLREEVHAEIQKFYHNPIDVALGLISGVNNSVYVSGEVRFPGVYPLIADMTALKALSLSGGVTPEGNLDEVVLIHYTSQNNVTVYKTSLTEVFNNASQLHDLILSPQDIIFVPKTAIAEANQFIDQYVNRMLPFGRSVNYNYNNK